MEQDKYRLDDFKLYIKAREYRKKIYKVVKSLPVEEKFVLNPQMRKAALSITNNIAEGHGRWQYQDNTKFCRIARGSTAEIIDDLNTCIDEEYCSNFNLFDLKDEGYELIKSINSYISYLQSKKKDI